MSELSFLTPKERARLDTTQLETLHSTLGAHAAEEVMCRAMEDLGTRLCQIHDRAMSGPREVLHRELRAIGAVAEQIGLSGVASVAHDVMNSVEHGDRIAEAATLARLARMGEQSLVALWDLQGLSV